MVDHRPRLTVWGDGEYALRSEGADGSSSSLAVRPDGVLFGVTTSDLGIREALYLEPEAGGAPNWAARTVFDAETRYRLLRAELGPWTGSGVSTVRYQDGVRAEVTRGRDYNWDQWETVKSPAHTTPKGWATGDNTGVTVFHPREAAPGGGTTQESFYYGSEDYKGHRSSSSTTQVIERDAAGNETRRTSVSGSYDHDSGTQERGVTIRYGNGDWVKQIHRAEKDGSWTDVTTTNQGGHYVVRVATGHGDTTETYKETESDEDPTGDDEDSQPEPSAEDSPTGDGTEPGGDEGNPDGPLSGVDIRDLIGDDGEGDEDLDTLGDLDGLMRPWLERIRATLAAGGGGSPDTGELLDTLGAPPVIDVYLTDYEVDDMAELDSLGRPRPIFGTRLQLAAELAAGSALTVDELQTAAGTFAHSAATVARSAELLRNR